MKNVIKVTKLKTLKRCLVATLLTISTLPLGNAQTSVLFPLTSMFGGHYAGTMTVTSQNPLTEDSNSFYLGTYVNVPVSGGTNPVVPLWPNQYAVTWSGVRQTMRITVPASTNVLNALTLTTNVPVFLFTAPNILGIATNVNNAMGTNVSLSGVFAGSFVGDASQLAGLPTNGFITQLQANLAATNAAFSATNTPALTRQGAAVLVGLTGSAGVSATLTTNASGALIGNVAVAGLSLTNLPAAALTNFQLGPVALATNATTTVSNLNSLGLIAGNGGGLTNLNASQLAAGAVPDSLLSTNVFKVQNFYAINGITSATLAFDGQTRGVLWATGTGAEIYFSAQPFVLAALRNPSLTNLVFSGNFIGTNQPAFVCDTVASLKIGTNNPYGLYLVTVETRVSGAGTNSVAPATAFAVPYGILTNASAIEFYIYNAGATNLWVHGSFELNN